MDMVPLDGKTLDGRFGVCQMLCAFNIYCKSFFKCLRRNGNVESGSFRSKFYALAAIELYLLKDCILKYKAATDTTGLTVIRATGS